MIPHNTITVAKVIDIDPNTKQSPQHSIPS